MWPWGPAVGGAERGGFGDWEEFAARGFGREVCSFVGEGDGGDCVWVGGEWVFLGVVFMEDVDEEKESEDSTPLIAEGLPK